ncbi:ankyrin repeat domain-containing protein [Vibrio intestinalis]|uniref:ankyrin repeat domain-containing protein n=1 Tax=Vibrio intestinalis TaxID=2933291 RepID=UPI0021A89526|nr:ankyrin repeat domain-containing protein [Vibrio intestinalis]
MSHPEFTYLELQRFAEAGDVSHLYMAQFTSNRQFHRILKILTTTKYSGLFTQVFHKEQIAYHSQENEFFVLAALAKLDFEQTFDAYFASVNFENWQQVFKNSLLTRYLKAFTERSLAEQMIQLGAKVDSKCLYLIKPDNPNFSWMLQHSDKTAVTAWLNEKLYKQLAYYKHPANYTPVAKAYLQQGHGMWQQPDLALLQEFASLTEHYQGYFYQGLSADWLMLSLLLEDEALFELCLSQGCDVNEMASNGMLALVEASGRQGMEEYATKLVAKGANVNYRDANNHSPLFAALARTNIDLPLVRLLLEQGAQVNHRTFTHETILHALLPHLSEELKQLLESYGARSHGSYQQLEEYTESEPF